MTAQPGCRPAGSRPRTELGNAERLVDQHGRDLRYAAGLGWLTWNGQRWKRDTDGEVVRRCKATVRSIYNEAAQAPSEDVAGELGKWAKASESSTRIAAAIELAKTERPVVIDADQLDADPWKLNVHNGTVDLRTGILHEHHREDLISKLAGAAYKPDAPAPRFAAFLERVLPDPDVRSYVQRLAGCAAVGEVREHVLPFLYGAGANGKTTLLDALRSVFGEYAIQLPSELLIAKREMTAGDQSAIAQLAGVRLATTIEVADGRRMAEVLVKELTGERRLRAKLMRRDHFEFDATHTILLAANHRPTVRGTDHAIWRRIHLIPFEVTIPADEQDTRLSGKLEAERDGILSWIVAGCLEWRRTGLRAPAAVQAATAEYKASQDPLTEWLDARCVLTPEAWTATKELRASYDELCNEEGIPKVDSRAFADALRDRGCVTKQGRSASDKTKSRGWLGIRFRQPDETPFEPESERLERVERHHPYNALHEDLEDAYPNIAVPPVPPVEREPAKPQSGRAFTANPEVEQVTADVTVTPLPYPSGEAW